MAAKKKPAARQRGIDWNQIGLVRRSERVDTRLMLKLADLAVLVLEADRNYTEEQLAELLAVPGQGGVSSLDRLREALTVWRWWPGEYLGVALVYGAAWHSLLEPTRADEEKAAAILKAVGEHIDATQAWPSVSFMRRLTGRAPTRRLPGEQEGQESLL